MPTSPPSFNISRAFQVRSLQLRQVTSYQQYYHQLDKFRYLEMEAADDGIQRARAESTVFR